MQCGENLEQCYGCTDKEWCKHYEHLKELAKRDKQLESLSKENQVLRQVIIVCFKHPELEWNEVLNETVKQLKE